MSEPALKEAGPSTALAKPDIDIAAAMERVMVLGDLSPLSAAQRNEYYMRVCQSIGVNYLTKPFAYIKLNGKLVLYALRDCTDQLRKIHGISIKIVDRKLSEGLLSIHVAATDKNGRTDEDFGVVPVVGSLTGEAGANLIMKCVTKAKRRVTLSISGLGMLDETEVVTIPDAELVEVDQSGEIKAVTPAKPRPKRKSSAQAKREGAGDRFKEIQPRILNAENPDKCIEIWLLYGEDMKTMARGWFELLVQDFMQRMKELGAPVDLDDEGWPVIAQREAAE